MKMKSSRFSVLGTYITVSEGSEIASWTESALGKSWGKGCNKYNAENTTTVCSDALVIGPMLMSTVWRHDLVKG